MRSILGAADRFRISPWGLTRCGRGCDRVRPRRWPGPGGSADRPRDPLHPLRTYHERFTCVAGTALLVFGVVGAVDALAVVLVVDDHVDRPVGAAVTSAAAAVFGMVGVVVYAGLLDKVVGAHIHGHPDLTPGDLAGAPLRRLVVADVLFAVAVLAASALFVIPGVIVFTLWALVGPVITIEDFIPWSPPSGRSWHLVRRRFWLTFGLVTLPVQFEQWALHAIHYAEIFDHPVVPAFLLNGVLETVIGSIVGLVEVVLTYELIEEDARRRPLASGDPSAA